MVRPILTSQSLEVSTEGNLGPVKNFTTVTIYTDIHTWSEADVICKMEGGQLLDITRYSLFRNLLNWVSKSPWKDIPIANGPQAWLGLHRRITPLGDWYYSEGCLPLTEFRVVYWSANNPVTADGDPTSYCVTQNFPQTTSGASTTTRHDYTRAHCNEKHRFYCQTESGPCNFEKVTRTLGDTRYDFSPGNDVTYAFESEAKCAELCSDASDIYPHPDLLVLEECWGFSITPSDCILHIVVTPSYFDSSSSKTFSSSSDLFIKRCYQSIPVTGVSTTTTREVFIYPGTWSWNDAYNICSTHGYDMITITNVEDYTAVKQIAEDYVNTQNMDYIWLGLHEPDPINHTSIRVWSDCTSNGISNWDSSSLPSSAISNTNWCVVMDTDTSLWYTVECNTQSYVLCSGELIQNKSYSSGKVDTTGSGTQLGPYNVTHTTCQDMCSQWTFQDEECWGYSIKHTGLELPECFLFFSNNSGVTSSNSGFTFYQKQIWKATFMNDTDMTTMTGDVHLVPKSCCDVSGQLTQCPANIIPSTNEDIPTTTKTRLIFHQTLATWNEANVICTSTGGTLVQLDDITKRTMLLTYIDDWTGQGLSFTDVWMGLSQTREADPCSLRWSKDCTAPGWVDFTGTAWEGDVINRCVSADSTLSFSKQPCNVRNKFVCEMNIGSCTFSSIYNVRCVTGPGDGVLTLTSTTCMTECQTQTYQGMECWTASMAGGNTCYLYFYVDPIYCSVNNGRMMSYDTVYKICYEAAVENSVLITSPDEELVPNHGCDSLLPYSSIDYMCAVLTTSTTSSTASTTSTMSTTNSLTSTTDSITSTTDSVTSATDSVTSTTEPATSTTEPATSTTEPATSATATVTSTTDFVTSTTEPATSTTEPATSTTELVTSTSDFVTSTTEPATSTTEPATSTTEPATSTTEPATSATAPVTSTTDFVTSTTEPATSTTEPATSTTELVTSTSDFVTSTTEPATSITEPTTSTTDPATSTTEPATSTTDPATSTTAPVTSTTDSVTSTTEPVTSTTESATSTSAPVTSTTDSVTSTTEPITSTTDSVTSTSSSVTSTTSSSVTSATYSSTSSSSSSSTSTTNHVMSSSTSMTPTNSTLSTSTVSSTSVNNVSSSLNTSMSTTSQSLMTTSSNSVMSKSTSSLKPANPIYIVACVCYSFNDTNMTIDEWRSWFDRNNKIGVHNTSRYRRKLISVYDGRTSTVTIGAGASFVLISFALYIVISDMPRLIREVIQIFCRRKLYVTT
ncbi:carbohydrate binding [Mactra antiquata]